MSSLVSDNATSGRSTIVPRQLFEPLRIGRTTVRNRVFSSAHGTGFARNGLINERHIAYHLERARGGIGLIVLEATSIDGSAMGLSMGRTSLRNSADDVIEPYQELAAALHAEDTKVFCLLSHAGRNTVMGPDGGPPLAPSPKPMDRTRDVPHALEVWELEQIAANFAAAALRCRQGGLDGVELSFTHGNLVQDFMSPATNLRTDEYGGDEEGRLRLAREVLQACRAAVGDDFTFGIRFTADELIPGGYTIEDAMRWAPMLVSWGKLDFIDVSAGTNASMWSRTRHYPTISIPDQPLVGLASRIREVVDIPVFCVAKIHDPIEAGRIVAEGHADMVAMTRAHIAEPEFVNKAREGRLDEIRSCIYCNESCFARQQRVGDITCVYNPRSGREAMWPPIRQTTQPRRVVVVGGGPAGLEAARTAAKAGHKVTLLEAGEALGGQLRYIPRTPTRQPYGKILSWYEDQLSRLDLDIRLGTEADADGVIALQPDMVVVATGAAPALPGIPIAASANVLTAQEVLDGAEVKGKVLLGDWDGRHMGMSVAEYLAARGTPVELASSTFFIGMDVDLLTWHASYERLLDLGVVMSPLEEMIAIDGDVARLRGVNGGIREAAADTFVLCTRGEARAGLYRALRGRVPRLEIAGDCWAPRQLEQAIFEGARAGRTIN